MAPVPVLLAPAETPNPPEAEALYNRFRTLFYDKQPGADEALAALEKAFPGHALALDARKRYEAPAKTRPGLKAPAFSIPSLEDPKTTLTLETFKGRYVLLEFWATWCPYCVKELPEIHKAYARFRGPRFEILSFSLDKKPEHAIAFRKAKHPMPWQHAFLPGMKAHPIAEAYGAAGIPKYVLVDPSGTICASDDELRGDKLETTLARFLEAPAAR